MAGLAKTIFTPLAANRENQAALNPALDLSNQRALLKNPNAAGVMAVGHRQMQDQINARKQVGTQYDMRAGNYGSSMRNISDGIIGSIYAGRAKKNGGLTDKQIDDSAAWKAAFGWLGEAAGDAGGGTLRAFGMQDAGDAAAAQAGLLAENRNKEARAGLLKEAEARTDAMNVENANTTAGMTDSAIARAGEYESAMQGIDSSGVEGSANMQRNLDYGQSRAEAAEQLQYDMMGNRAQELNDAMVNSFSDLSQNKAAAMTGAWGNSVRGQSDALTQNYMDKAGALSNMTNPNLSDEQSLIQRAEGAALEKPMPAEADTAGQAAPAGLSNDNYAALEKFLSTKQSGGGLTNEMNRLGISDPAMQQKIQAATMSGQAGWRDRLRGLVR
jgi:hypothetical protein